MSDESLLISTPEARPARIVRITRSFSYKLNVGNYESQDFFCSQSGECDESEAAEVSADLQQFCVDQVLEAVREYRANMNAQRERKSA